MVIVVYSCIDGFDVPTIAGTDVSVRSGSETTGANVVPGTSEVVCSPTVDAVAATSGPVAPTFVGGCAPHPNRTGANSKAVRIVARATGATCMADLTLPITRIASRELFTSAIFHETDIQHNPRVFDDAETPDAPYQLCASASPGTPSAQNAAFGRQPSRLVVWTR